MSTTTRVSKDDHVFLVPPRPPPGPGGDKRPTGRASAFLSTIGTSGIVPPNTSIVAPMPKVVPQPPPVQQPIQQKPPQKPQQKLTPGPTPSTSASTSSLSGGVPPRPRQAPPSSSSSSSSKPTPSTSSSSSTTSSTSGLPQKQRTSYIKIPVRPIASSSYKGIGSSNPKKVQFSNSNTIINKNRAKLAETEYKRELSELIQECQSQEDKVGIDAESCEKIKRNIARGRVLFNKMGGSSGEMLLSFMHTRLIASMLKYKSECIGSEASGFKLDTFLDAISELVNNEAINPEEKTAQLISVEAGNCMRTLPPLISLIGSFDRDLIQVPKIKKERIKVVRRKFDNTDTTQHEEININLTAEQRKKTDFNSPEHLSKEIYKIMDKEFVQQGNTPINLLKFTVEKKSIAKTIENLFYVSFLIRDGSASLNSAEMSDKERKERKKSRLSLANLVLKPEKPPASHKAKPEKIRTSNRNQLIVSFSPRMWKNLSEKSNASSSIISHYQGDKEVITINGIGSSSSSSSKGKGRGNKGSP